MQHKNHWIHLILFTIAVSINLIVDQVDHGPFEWLNKLTYAEPSRTSKMELLRYFHKKIHLRCPFRS